MGLARYVARYLPGLLPRYLPGGGDSEVWTPALWFLANEQGIWLDPSDFTRYMGEYGSELVDTANTAAAWNVSGTNTIIDDAGAVKITYVNASDGGAMLFSAAKGLTTDLTNGKWYWIEFKARVASGNNLAVQVVNAVGGTITLATLTSTEYQTCRTAFQKGTLTPSLTMALMSAGEMVWVKDITVRELTAINTATLFQDSAGALPVTAVEQPVGLALDLRKGMHTPLVGTWSKNSGDGVVTVSGGDITITGATTTTRVDFSINASATAHGIVSVSAANVAGAVSPLIYLHGGPQTLTSGAAAYRGVNTTSASIIRVQLNSGSLTVSIASIVELVANHASQATTAQKPVLSARKNLLTYSEDFSNAAWTKQANAAITANSAAAPDGTTTADTYTSSGASDGLFATISGLVAGEQLATIIRVKQGTGRWLRLQCYDGSNGYRVWIDTQTSTIGTSNTVGAGATLTSAAVAALADGWMQVTLVGTAPSTLRYVQLNSVTADASSTQASGTYYVWGAHTERGASVAAYQWIRAATDYDTVGFPHYLKFDGVDDNLVTGNIDFTATDKMTVMAALTKLADNNGLVVELGTSAATVDGTFSMQAGAGSTANYTFELRGTAACGYRAPSPAAPDTSVVTGLLDIAGADRTTEIVPRIDGVLAGAPTGGAVGPAGTGNFISAPLYIGRRAGTSQPFSGFLNQLVVRGAFTADVTPGETYVAGKTGITL